MYRIVNLFTLHSQFLFQIDLNNSFLKIKEIIIFCDNFIIIKNKLLNKYIK